ncbi:MAG: hypothetical protein ACRDXX_22180, partial [Stackebrandtia sp.]
AGLRSSGGVIAPGAAEKVAGARGGWGHNPWVKPADPGPTLRAGAGTPVVPAPRIGFGRNPWVRPEEGNAVYPSAAPPRPEADEPETADEADAPADPEAAASPPEDADSTEDAKPPENEPPLDPVTLSRLLAEATPEDREKILAAEAVKLGINTKKDADSPSRA